MSFDKDFFFEKISLAQFFETFFRCPYTFFKARSDGNITGIWLVGDYELASTVAVTATYTCTNSNYAGSTDTKSLKVESRNASYVGTGYYTGDVFVWTTSSTRSTGTVTLSTTIKDAETPLGDVRSAKVTFYMQSGTTLTPIPGASNLPVGLVDVSDGSVGTASAIVQLNIGSQNAANFQIVVGIAGAYKNDPRSPASSEVLTVSKPVPGGFIVGGGALYNAPSSGMIKGASNLSTCFGFDVSFNNKLTNPQGKVCIMVKSYNKPDGTLDNVLHTYMITSNAISLLSVGKPDQYRASFSSKANLVEQLPDGTSFAIEGGSILQLSMTDKGPGKGIDYFSIALQRKAGGLWISSSWDGTKTVEQQIKCGSLYVSTSGFTLSSTSLKAGSLEESMVETATPEIGNMLNVYPNPSNGPLNFKFTIAENSRVIIDLKSMSGKAVARIFDAEVMAGDYNMVEFNDVLTPGVYVYQMSWNDKVITRKLTIAY